MNYLDVSFNLKRASYYPYKKTKQQPTLHNTKSNHPPNIIKLPAAINRRVSNISCNETEFNKAQPIYEDALQSSGYNQPMTFNNQRSPPQAERNRQQNIIWYNPPFSKSVKTNIGKTFLKLINKHSNKDHKFHKLFNKNNIKVSYNCTDNMGTIISKHNEKVINNTTNTNPSSSKTCSCQKKDKCLLNNNTNNLLVTANTHAVPNFGNTFGTSRTSQRLQSTMDNHHLSDCLQQHHKKL